MSAAVAPRRWKERVALALGAFAGGMILVSVLYVAVASFAFDLGKYPQEAPFDRMASALVDYLRGDAQALPPIFTDRESLHMVDVLALFRGGRQIALIFAVFGFLFCVFGWILGGSKRLAAGLQIGFAAFATMVGFVGAWALVDFSGWFTVMHELAFANDLWLLDPATSLLIQMLLLPFFVNAVRVIALRFISAAALLLCVSIGIRRFSARKDSAS